jgi:hypothetical protein
LKKIIIFDKKINKINSEKLVEIDSEDLEPFGHFTHGKDYLKIPSKSIDNKTILEWFSLKNISYWWFVSPTIHPKYKEAIIFIENFSLIIDDNASEIVHIRGCYDKLDLIKQLCKNKKIKFKISNLYYVFQIKEKLKNIIKKPRFKKITKHKQKLRLNCFKKTIFEKPAEGYVLVTSPGVYRRKATVLNGETKNIEFFIEPLLEIFEKNKISNLCVDLDYTFKGDIQALQERLKSKNQWMPLELILKNPITEQSDNSIKNLKNSVKEFLRHDVKEIFSYKNISLSKYLKPTIESTFLYPYIPYYFNIMENIRIFLKETKPSIIVQVYEAGPYAKAIQVVAKELGIKTIGIQHGVIPSDYPDYMAPEISTEKFPIGNPIPDLTLVYGEFYQKLLTEVGNYPKNSVISIGHPSYYNIDEIKKSISSDMILKKYQLADKKIILIPLSSRFNKKSLDSKILNVLFNHFKNNSSVTILIRPHPGDKLDQKIISKLYPSNNFIYSNHSLTEDFCICDVIVSLPVSSVTTEAVLFNKPIILVNTFEKIKINDVYLKMIECDVAIISSINELPQKIDIIQKNNFSNIENKKLRNDFLNLFFNQDKNTQLLDLFK